MIEVDISELVGKSKELDLTKLLEMYQDIQAGKEVKIFNNMITIKKVEDKKKK
ncbi:MAG: hypothetical protein WCV90_08935 [Candidatus Woesearchaeota archaeon]